jgi:glycosyltransferase involved in cell wall biosynthesis
MTVSGRVSVIIAVKDGAAFIEDGITSVAAQTHPDVELIVVDDGSTDDTAGIVRATGIGRLIELPANFGPAHARNVGLAVATGEYVTFLDADDLYAPTKIEFQLARLASRPECSVSVVGQEMRLTPGVEPPEWHRDADGETVPAPMCVLLPMSTVLLAGGFDASYRLSEDTEWLVRIEHRGLRPDLTIAPLYIRRLHGANATYDHDGLKRGLLRAARARLHRQRDPGPDVEVIIPVRNGAAYLGEAIASVAGQAGPRIAVIVVDDGSTDGSAEVAASLSTEQVPVRVVRQPPLGSGAARNHGVLASRAPLLAFLDADDVWVPGKLAAQLEALEEAPHAGVVIGWIDEFGEPDRPEGVRLRPPGPAYVPSVSLVRRQVFGLAGPFAPDPMTLEWMEWWARVVDAGVESITLPDVLAHRRVHGHNRTWTDDLLARGEYHKVLRATLARRRAGS